MVAFSSTCQSCACCTSIVFAFPCVCRLPPFCFSVLKMCNCLPFSFSLHHSSRRLSHNPLGFVSSEAFANLSALTTLHLQNTCLRRVPAHLFEPLLQLSDLYVIVYGSVYLWLCVCDIVPFLTLFFAFPALFSLSLSLFTFVGCVPCVLFFCAEGRSLLVPMARAATTLLSASYRMPPCTALAAPGISARASLASQT